VLANPPFSQNYAKTKSKDDGSGAKKKEPIAYPGRFHVWMPEKGKKADLMFVQHMLAVLKSDGRMATVMPHGVLFRGGEEREARQYFIDKGYLEAVIGLPSQPVLRHGHPGLHPGAEQGRRPAARPRAVHQCRPRIPRRQGAEPPAPGRHRQDRARLPCRAEHRRLRQARAGGEIKAEDYNCNIRRYVDNAPPPEPHDVRAHLHGGVPVAEIDALAHFWHNYTGLRESIFVPRATATHGIWYADFAAALADKRAIARTGQQHPGVQQRHAQFMTDLAAWWQQHLPVIEALAPDADNQHAHRPQRVRLRATLLESIERTFGQASIC
jgi:type I restriction enzyme M protein